MVRVTLRWSLLVTQDHNLLLLKFKFCLINLLHLALLFFLIEKAADRLMKKLCTKLEMLLVLQTSFFFFFLCVYECVCKLETWSNCVFCWSVENSFFELGLTVKDGEREKENFSKRSNRPCLGSSVVEDGRGTERSPNVFLGLQGWCSSSQM